MKGLDVEGDGVLVFGQLWWLGWQLSKTRFQTLSLASLLVGIVVDAGMFLEGLLLAYLRLPLYSQSSC